MEFHQALVLAVVLRCASDASYQGAIQCLVFFKNVEVGILLARQPQNQGARCGDQVSQ